jgi:outer membrane biosynthesis protein TonB
MSMPLRLVLLFALASVLLMANEQQQVPSCCESESEKLSQSQVRALVKKTEPIDAPCCADMLHISGTVVLAISVDPFGNVACLQTVSGHPLIIGVAIDSVRQWKFEPYTSKGIKKTFCGQVALRFQANEHAVKYKII